MWPHWLHLLKKSLIENCIFCAVCVEAIIYLLLYNLHDCTFKNIFFITWYTIYEKKKDITNQDKMLRNQDITKNKGSIRNYESKMQWKKVLNLDEGTSVKRNTTFFRIIKNETNANFKWRQTLLCVFCRFGLITASTKMSLKYYVLK